MKLLLFIFSMVISLALFSQKSRVDFAEIDRYAQTVPSGPVSILARQLTAPYQTELEKVRSIFRWIADNIDYRTHVTSFRRRGGKMMEPAEDTGVLKPLDERVAESVLEKGTAVCDGYARLFKTLCTYAGIRSELVTGYARTNAIRANNRFRSNHTWNAVWIDSAWKLLDVTWASGYISWHGNNFVRHFGEEYFLSEPADFINEHYPDDMRWTLLDQIPSIPEFRHSPYKQRTFIKYSVAAYRPAKGLLEANLGDTLQVEIDIANPERDGGIGADPFLDTSQYNSIHSALLVATANTGNKLTYTYLVSSPLVQWLYILYNNDVILRYRLLVRNGNSVAINTPD